MEVIGVVKDGKAPPARIHAVEQVWIEITQHAPQALADPAWSERT